MGPWAHLCTGMAMVVARLWLPRPPPLAVVQACGRPEQGGWGQAVLPPHTRSSAQAVPGCVKPSHAAWLVVAQSWFVEEVPVHSLRLQGMEGMARRCLSRSPLLAAVPVAGVPMPTL